MTRQAERLEISDQIIESVEYLESKKYSKYTINNHLAVWKRLKRFAKSAGTTYFSKGLVANFLSEVYGVMDGVKLNKHQANAMRSIRILCDAFQ